METLQDIPLQPALPGAFASGADQATMIAVVAASFLYCFAGYRLLKFMIGLTGFVLAGTVAAVFAAWLSDGHAVVVPVVGIIGGICGAMALFFIYRAGIFCVGSLGGGLIANNLLAGLDLSWAPWAMIGVAILAGAFAVFIQRPVVILATAVIGAWGIVGCLAFFVVNYGLGEDLWDPSRFFENRTVLLTIWALIALIGAVAQFTLGKKKQPKPDKD